MIRESLVIYSRVSRELWRVTLTQAARYPFRDRFDFGVEGRLLGVEYGERYDHHAGVMLAPQTELGPDGVVLQHGPFTDLGAARVALFRLTCTVAQTMFFSEVDFRVRKTFDVHGREEKTQAL